MSNLNLSTSCITYSAERPSERVKEFLQNSIVSKSQLSQYVSLNSFDEKVPADRIPQIIEELRQYEQLCVENDQYLEADKCVKKIEALQKQEVKFTEKTKKIINKGEMSELEEINLQQFQEFNDTWDKAIENLRMELKKKETDMILLHEEQLEKFDENSKNIVFPKTKYSPEVISLRSLLDKLNKNKRYLESHEIKKRILELECRDEQKWLANQDKKIQIQRVQLIQKQQAELHALQTKLEDQLQLNIRDRKNQMNKYAQWLQNMKQELSVTHGLELSRIVSNGEKRNSKVSGGLCNSSMLLSSNYSQLLDMSKSYTTGNGNSPSS